MWYLSRIAKRKNVCYNMIIICDILSLLNTIRLYILLGPLWEGAPAAAGGGESLAR